MNIHLKKSLRPLAVLLTAGALIGVFSMRARENAPDPVKTAPAVASPSRAPAGQVRLSARSQAEAGIVTLPLAGSQVSGVVRANGQLVMDEERTWQVGAVTEGKVVRVLVKTGDFVKQGQPLALLHSHVVHESRAAFQQAGADLEKSRASYGLAVRANARAQRLLALEAISREQADQTANDLQGAQMNVRKAEAGVEKERQHLTEFLEVAAEDSHRSGRAAGGDPDAVPVKSPAAGIVMRRMINVGSVLSPGDEAFTVSDISSLWMIAAVNEADLSAVRAGRPVNVSVRAYPESSFRGRVLRLGEEMDAATRTLKVRVQVPNPRGLLKPEMFAAAEIESGGARPALYVPEAAAQDLNGQRAVFVQISAEFFEPRAIGVRQTVNGLMEIQDGLKEGDRVVIRGGFALKTELLKSSLQAE